jgi:hypothetical protein
MSLIKNRINLQDAHAEIAALRESKIAAEAEIVALRQAKIAADAEIAALRQA